MKPQVPLVFLLLGIVFGGVGTGFGVWSAQFAASAAEVDGLVIEMRRARKGGSRPLVEYRVGDQTYSVEGRISTRPPAYAVGDQVRVLYRSADPADARIDSFVERWLFCMIFGGIGALFLAVSLVLGCIQWWTAPRLRD